MKGMTTCKVCGRDFPLIFEDHYIVQDPRKIGAFANLMNTDKEMEFDAFDCPHCRCQNVMQERKPIWMPEACGCDKQEEESEDNSQTHNGCFGCIHHDVPADEHPCCDCRGTKADFYKKED